MQAHDGKRRVAAGIALGLLLGTVAPVAADVASPDVTPLADCGREREVTLQPLPRLTLGGQLGEKRSLMVPLQLRNCTDQPAVLEEVLVQFQEDPELPSYGRRDVHYSSSAKKLDVTLPPSSGWRGAIEIKSPGRFELRMTVRYPRFTKLGAPRATFTVVDEAWHAAIAACRRCRGDWGPHYRSGAVDCRCRTSDGNKPCRGSDQCSAGCDFRRFETLRRDKVCDATGQCQLVPVGRAVGVCYEFTSVMSCVRWIPAGAWKDPPRRVPFELPQECAD